MTLKELLIQLKLLELLGYENHLVLTSDYDVRALNLKEIEGVYKESALDPDSEETYSVIVLCTRDSHITEA